MIRVVMDTSVLVAACGWRGDPYRLLVAAARRQVQFVITHEILREYEVTVRRVGREEGFADRVDGTLAWIECSALLVDPVPLGKQRSRDITDDKFLAAALAGSAGYVLSYDDDLLALGKPFGVTILTPEDFLRILDLA